MKNQYFGDKRDFVKYGLLLDLLEGLPRVKQLTALLMLTPEDGTGEGRFTKYPAGEGRKDLAEMLSAAVKAKHRDVRHLHTFLLSKRINYHLWQDEPLFSEATRQAYFSGFPREWLKNAVVFLDPDIGLRRPTKVADEEHPKYVMEADLAGLRPEIVENSVVVLYQHLQNDLTKAVQDLKERGARFGEALGFTQVRWIQDGHVAFLVATGNPELRAEVDTVLLRFAKTHGLVPGETHKVDGAGEPVQVPRKLPRGAFILKGHGREGDYEILVKPDPPLPDPNSPEGIANLKRTIESIVAMALEQLMKEKETAVSPGRGRGPRKGGEA